MISYSSLKENCFFKEIYILSNTSFEAGRFEKNMLKMLNIINIVQKYINERHCMLCYMEIFKLLSLYIDSNFSIQSIH